MDPVERLSDEIINCTRCPRLVDWCRLVAAQKKREFRDWDYWGKPIPPMGRADATLLVVGLAPAAHGGTRTGRVFTGDSSGDFLFAALHKAGFANQPTSRHRGDGLEVIDAYITAVARCAPPANKPTTEELANCRPFLLRELEMLTELRAVICLGKIAFDNYLAALRRLGHTVPRVEFGHARAHDLGTGLPTLIASYHPSRQNTNTGRLTKEMFDAVFTLARRVVDGTA